MKKKVSTDQKWFVYMVETDRHYLYTGITTDVEKRFEDHRQGRGAKFFRMHTPKKVVFVEKCDSKSHAARRENDIKKLKSDDKRKLLNILIA